MSKNQPAIAKIEERLASAVTGGASLGVMDAKLGPKQVADAGNVIGLVLTLVLLPGCRDLVLTDGSRLASKDIVSSRGSLSVAEVHGGGFLSTDTDLRPLVRALRSTLMLTMQLSGLSELRAAGVSTAFDPRPAAVLRRAAQTSTRTLTSPLMSFELRSLLSDYRALCEHPALGTVLDGVSCATPTLDVTGIKNLRLSIDAANVTARWEAPAFAFETMTVDSPERFQTCGAPGEVASRACRDGYRCRTDASARLINGVCELDRPCGPAMGSDPACSDSAAVPQGWCGEGGVCSIFNRKTGPGLDVDAERPVLVLTVPFAAAIDTEDWVDPLVQIEISRVVVEYRLQAIPCKGETCRLYGRTLFKDYPGPGADARASSAGLDVRVRSRMVGRDFKVIPTPLCPITMGDGIVFSGLCAVFAAQIPGTIDAALGGIATTTGNFLDILVSAPRMPNDSDIGISPASIVMSLNAISGEVAQTTTLGDATGAWTQGTIALLARGGMAQSINLTASLGGASVPFTLCPKFFNPPDGCVGLPIMTLADLAPLLHDLAPDADVPSIFQKLVDVSRPLAPVPTLATLMDGFPLLAMTIQSWFTAPLDKRFPRDQAHYNDSLWCPSGGRRAPGCPASARGAYFMFDLDDADHDFIVDAKDNCVVVYNPNQSDTDRDGIGDVCDDDRDGDLCNNETDDDPDNASIVAGEVYANADNCFPGFSLFISAMIDVDGDKLPGCADDDDDGDGILDAVDRCPEGDVPGPGARQDQCHYSVQGSLCPIANPDAFRACRSRGCFERIDRQMTLERPSNSVTSRALRHSDVRVIPNRQKRIGL